MSELPTRSCPSCGRENTDHDACDKRCARRLEPEVLAFAESMLDVLGSPRNAAKGDPRDGQSPLLVYMSRLRTEMHELYQEVADLLTAERKGDESEEWMRRCRERIGREAADVGAYAMFVSLLAGALDVYMDDSPLGRTRELEAEVESLEEEATRLREGLADEWRKWAEGGTGWKLERENEALRGFLASITSADDYVEDEADEVRGVRELTMLEVFERDRSAAKGDGADA